MELTKAQKALLSIPSRWPPVTLGITLSLLISAIFFFNFASRIIPAPIAAAGSPPSAPASFPSLSNQLLIIFFRNSFSQATPTDDSTLSQINYSPSPMTVAQETNAYDSSLSSPLSSELSRNGDGEVKANNNAERVHNESLVTQEAPVPSPEPLLAGSVSSQKVNVLPHNRTSPANRMEPLSNATTSRNHRGETHGSISSPEGKPRNGHKELVPAPGSNSSINPVHIQPPLAAPKGSLDAEACDVSVGQWVQDDSYPLYRPGACSFVDEAFSCQRNLRPDSKYNRWRWAPRHCNVPRFNGTDLLERLRGKRLVFVGDSLNRNQWESMLCMLRESLKYKRRIVQINGGRISKLPGAYVFKFVDYECKVEFYTSSYLVDKEEGRNQTQFTIRLDRMDKSERRWRKADVLVFNTGHWWTSDKIGKGDHRFQEGSTVYPKFDVKEAYNKALSTWAKWVDTHVNPRNTSVFFRGYSPVHYIGGQWNSGGQCKDETEPIFDESFLTPYPSEMQTLEGVLHKMKLPVQVLNITRLSDYRKDAHPATYGHAPHYVVEHQDCSHWCLPGLPDTWNELLYFALVKQSLSVP